MRLFRILLLILFLLPAAVWASGWLVARPDYPWRFPQDHWARPGYRTEWWYFTGHLTSASGRRFGYQFTFFRVGLMPRRPDLNSDWATANLVMGHAAVTDLAAGRHIFSEVVYRAIPLLGGFGTYPDSVIAWSRAPAGTGKKWVLRWNGKAFDFSMADAAQGIAFSLSTVPAKPMIFEGPDGYSRKGAGPTAASQYYSFTRLRTKGTVQVGTDTLAVTGESWMDKEFGSDQLGPHQIGWDWFSLQLDDGRDIMLYLLRDKTGKVDFARGTVVSKEGKTRYLAWKDFSVQATATWTSPETGAKYPSRWIVDVPGQNLRLTVVPELADQENRSRKVPSLFYWEGAVRARFPNGERAGEGYVELVGYGTKNRPAM